MLGKSSQSNKITHHSTIDDEASGKSVPTVIGPDEAAHKPNANEQAADAPAANAPEANEQAANALEGKGGK